MSEVEFNIKLTLDGKERLVSATTDVQHFAEAFEEAKAEASKTRDSLLKITQTAQSFQNVLTGIQQVTGVLRDLTAAYSEQEVVETKLANNMRNTMGARDADIQKIKELCAAQQELGVIGDEVQLAGAQEMTTYLEKTSSLEKLIPVMNDMLAQQYGLNATSEQAANIAMMLGKVMEGQTGALSRYGYYFDEAQEKILKYGTEEERAATLAKIVTDSVGGMNAELTKTDAGKAKQLTNQIGDLKEQMGALFIKIEPVLVAIGEVGLAITGLSTSYQGIKGIIESFSQWSKVTNVQKVATKLLSAAQKEAAALTVVWNRAQIAWTFGAKGAAVQMVALRVAVTALKAAIVGGGLLLLIEGVCGLLSKLTGSSKKASDGLDDMSESAQRAKAAEEEEQRVLRETGAQLKIHIGEIEALEKARKNGVNVKEQEKKLVAELNNTYGETMGYFASVSQWYDALIKNSDAYCRQMVIEARTRRMANELAEMEEDLENRKDIARIATKTIGSGGEDDKRVKKDVSFNLGGQGYDIEVRRGSKYFEKKLGVDVLEKDIQRKEERIKKIALEGAEIKMPVMGSKTAPVASHTTDHKNTSKNELSLIANPKTLKDFANNARYYGEELEKTNVTETEKLLNLARLKREAENTASSLREMLEVSSIPADPKTLEEYETTLQHYQKLRKKATAEDIKGIDEVIKKLEEGKSKLDGTFVPKTRKEELEEELEKVQRSFDALPAVNVAGKVLLSAKKAALQEELDALTGGVLTIGAEVVPQYIVKGSREDKRQSLQNAMSRIGQIQSDYESGIINKEQALKEIDAIQEKLKGLHLEPIQVELQDKGALGKIKKLDELTQIAA